MSRVLLKKKPLEDFRDPCNGRGNIWKVVSFLVKHLSVEVGYRSVAGLNGPDFKLFI